MGDDGEKFRERPNVVPISGFHLPPPPDWRLTDETKHLRQLAEGVLEPEDLTLRGMPRCTSKARSTGIRCGNEAVPGMTVCKFHGGGGAKMHPDDPAAENANGAQARIKRIEQVRTYLELTAQAAVTAVESILMDDMARPQDRLKAAEIVLDRTVGRQISVDKEDAQERDLDAEIMAIADSLSPTGTEGAGPDTGN